MGGFANLTPGVIFAEDYRIVRPLAEGGMGSVFVVDQISTGKSRALKLMRPELSGDPDLRRRFEQEAKIGSRIESEHVVEIVAAGIDEETQAPFLAMELLVGEDLATRIERAGPLTPGETLDLFEQLCHAVGAAHEAGIVHRDLKPENVFLASTKRAGTEGRRLDVKVLDFGIAKLVAESTTKGATQGMIGTPLWMAPEQTERGKITPAADVWALGLMLYHALTGRRFWLSGADIDATFSQVLKEILMGPLPSASIRAREQGVAASWPSALDTVFGRAVKRNPLERFSHAGFFWANLQEALAPLAPSSQRILVPVAPSSARVIAQGASPANALDQTAPTPAAAAVAPAPIPLPEPPPGPSLLSAPLGGGLTEIAGIPVRAFVGAVGALFLILLTVGINIVRHRAMERRDEVENARIVASREGDRIILPAGPPASPPTTSCRICTVSVKADGGLTRTQVSSAVEAAFPLIEAQCLVRRGARSGTLSLDFVVRDGRPGGRRVTSASTNEADCIERAFADISFPQADEKTDVSYSLKIDPNAR